MHHKISDEMAYEDSNITQEELRKKQQLNARFGRIQQRYDNVVYKLSKNPTTTFTFVISDTAIGNNVTNNIVALYDIGPIKLVGYAKKAPSSGSFNAKIMFGGTKMGEVTIAQGSKSAATTMEAMTMDAGSICSIDVTSSGDAEDVTIQFEFAVL